MSVAACQRKMSHTSYFLVKQPQKDVVRRQVQRDSQLKDVTEACAVPRYSAFDGY